MNMEKFLKSLNEEQKAALIGLLQNEEQEVTEELASDQEDQEVGENFVVKNRNMTESKGRSEVKGGKNKWVDTGEFRDVTTPDVDRTPRRKSPPKKTRVECHVCGKSFKADPRYLHGEYHRCNQCTGR